MTVSGTHPAFPLAPAVRAKPEKGEMAEIHTFCTQGHQKKVRDHLYITQASDGMLSENRFLRTSIIVLTWRQWE